jgi:diguanylate cyclase (GGDEF)-like protein
MDVAATGDADGDNELDDLPNAARGLIARIDEACRGTTAQPDIAGAGCLLLDADGALNSICATGAAARALAAAEEVTGEGPLHEALMRARATLDPVTLDPTTPDPATPDPTTPDPTTPTSWPQLARLLAASPIASVVAMPVMCGPAPVGVVFATSPHARAWADEAVDAVRSLADHVGRSVDVELRREGERSAAGPDHEGDDEGEDGDDAQMVGQLVAGLDARHELDQVVNIIARQTGDSALRSARRLRQLAAGMDVPALTIARRIVEHGRLPHPHEFLADASERSHREELARLALTDPLTGLANRVLLLDRLEHAVWRSQRGRDRPAVLYIDLDGFKLVNDTLGHAIGDHVLRTSAARILASVRPQDTVGRMGGDEFAVVCEAVEGTQTALAIARRIARAVEQPITLDELAGSRTSPLPTTADVGASIGIAVAQPGQPADDVLRAADAAMYRSKLGPGHITVHDHPAAGRRRSNSG